MDIKRLLTAFLPYRLKHNIYYLKLRIWKRYLIYTSQRNHSHALKVVRNRDIIKVAFFVIHKSVWKYEGLYRLMETDSRFDPVIIVCPYVSYGSELMFEELEACYSLFVSGGYKVVKSLREDSNWLDVKKEVCPDLIFFTNPHDLTLPHYLIRNFTDTLTCYVPYAFMTPDTYEEQFNQLFHNILWKAFYETPIHKEIATTYADNKGANVIVTGYPGCDVFINEEYIPKDPWKIKDRGLKRIIWAPHHLMKEGSKQSNFLDNFDLFLSFAKANEDLVQIAFKPHPIVKAKLYSYPEWGVERTDRYYEEWDKLPNGQLEEGDYVDLFLTSDALIHDCGSFITEFIFTGKPSLFMVSNESVMKGWNKYGDLVLEKVYKSHCNEDIFRFLQEIVLDGNDWMLPERESFLRKVLLPPNNTSAAVNIFSYLQAQFVN